MTHARKVKDLLVEFANLPVIYTDGSAIPNPGPCGSGVVLLANGENREVSFPCGIGSNNVGEVHALGIAFTLISLIGLDSKCLILSDSLYAINIAKGVFKSKKLKDLCRCVRALFLKVSKTFHVQLEYIPALWFQWQ